VKGVSTHGTGCTYSAAICAALALGYDLPHAVELGKNFITNAIADSYRAGDHFALRNFDGSWLVLKIKRGNLLTGCGRRPIPI
jgi:hydroxymethylpyrimidine/phosphomethylpyrimidine kinase